MIKKTLFQKLSKFDERHYWECPTRYVWNGGAMHQNEKTILEFNALLKEKLREDFLIPEDYP